MTPLAIALLQTAAEVRQVEAMSTFSWLFMLTSMGAVTLLTAWCFLRVLTTRRHFDPDGTGPELPPAPGQVEREGRRP
jgi:hypothetical protein